MPGRSVLLIAFLTVQALRGQARLTLSTTSVVPGVTASLDLSLDAPSDKPAALQWSFQYAQSVISSITVGDGPAIGAAGKTVVCAPNPSGYACVAEGLNANTLSSGVVARVTAVLAPGAINPSIQVLNPLAATREGYFMPISASSAASSVPSTPLTPVLVTPSSYSDVPLNTTLSWTGQGGAFFDVYFGPSPSPPLVASNLAATRYTPGSLAPCTTYYWKAVAKSAGVNASSLVYSFTTIASVQLSKNVDIFLQPGGNGSVQVTSSSGCPWKVSWSPSNTVAVTSGISGVGNGTVNYSVPQNTGVASRMSSVQIADHAVAVLQDGVGPSSRCVTQITGPAFIDSSPQTVTFNISADQNCNWSLSDNHVDWVALPGAQNAPAATVASNTSGASRSDDFLATPAVSAAYSSPFTVTQRAVPLTFADVPPPYPFFDAIGLLWGRSITGGCSSDPPRFCPDDNITRGQMAVFIVRAIMGGDSFSYNSTPYFDDAPSSYPFFKWIQKMWELGITSGCGPSAYCPDSPVTRGQMAVFIIRTRLGPTAAFNYPPDALFNDTIGNGFYSWIQKMGQLGITAGCAAGQYCPDSPVTRGQMAVFIMRGAFNQLLPGPRPLVLSVVPNTASPGQTMSVSITGQNTYFNGGTPQVTAGPGITVTNISVSSATTLTAQLSVAPDAATGPRSITVTIPGEIEATLPNGFRVQ
jgi:hypothetical protein